MNAADIPLDCARGTSYDVAREAGSTEGAARALQLADDLGVHVQGVQLPVRVHVLRTGCRQKAAGAWSWILYAADNREVLASADRLRDVLRAHRAGTAGLVEDAYGARLTPEVST